MGARKQTATPEPVTSEIRITDGYIARLVAEEQARTGETSAAKVASRLITERLAIRETRSSAGQHDEALSERRPESPQPTSRVA